MNAPTLPPSKELVGALSLLRNAEGEPWVTLRESDAKNLIDEIERLRRSEALLLEIQKSMADCIGTKEGQTFEDRAEELIVTEVQHMHCSAHEPGPEQDDDYVFAAGHYAKCPVYEGTQRGPCSCRQIYEQNSAAQPQTADICERLGRLECDVLRIHGVDISDQVEDLIQFYRRPSQPPAVTLPPLDDGMRKILGRPNFACAQLAHFLRQKGHEIKTRAEDEQAAVLHWSLGLYLQHGAKWIQAADEYLRPSETKGVAP